MSLYRGNMPLTREQQLDYEVECVLNSLCEQGLALRRIDADGRSRYAPTLRGRRELDPDFYSQRAFETPSGT